MQAGPDYAEGLINKMRTVIRRDPHQGDATHKTAHSASFGQRLRRRLPGSPHPKPSDSHSPPNGPMSSVLASSAGWANRRPFSFIIIALVAALAVSVSALLLSGLVQAQATGDVYEYAENGKGPVVVFNAGDPEGVDTIVWSLVPAGDAGIQNIDGDLTTGVADNGDDVLEADLIDAADFKISANGELSFKKSPDYETPTGRTTDAANTYKVVVQASDGGTSNDTINEMAYLTWYKVTVKVTDAEEEGKITLKPYDFTGGTVGLLLSDVTLVQPHVGVQIAAALSDPDGPATIPPANITWRWYRTSDPAQEGEVILTNDGTAELATATHTPRDTAGASDAGMYLRVKATYEDRRGKRKTAVAVTPHPVLAAIVNTNTPPEFAAGTAERRVNENTPLGTVVGRPVTAVDPDVEILSYSLVPAASPNEDDLDSFKIDAATGQITVNADLDFEDQQEYMFEVRATDSRTGTTNPDDNVMVTVKVTDLDEKPEIGPTPESVTASMMIVHAGGNAIEHLETDPVALAVYLITDDDEGTPALSLSGDDAAMFTFRYNAVTDVPTNDANLAFSAKPDFENPADSGTDNIYEVTLQANDGNNTGTLDVTVKVTNAEEAGKVALSHQQPLIGQEVTATLTDSDGGFGPNDALTRVTWKWARTYAETGCPADPTVQNTEWITIKGASENTYTPTLTNSKPIPSQAALTTTVSDDGHCLRASARYLDRTFDYLHAPVPVANATDEGVGFVDTAFVISGVVREDPANSKPEFPGAAVRFVPENTPANRYVDRPVTASDADRDVLTYSLDGGADKGLFYIEPADKAADADPTNDGGQDTLAGQIRVKALTKLDHENKPKYDFEVDATDSTSDQRDAFASTDVDVYVTDVDEKPELWVMDAGDRVTGEYAVRHKENDTGTVLTLMASDPEGVRSGIVWSLLTADTGIQDVGLGEPGDDVALADVADHASFKISSSGVLSFKNKPDYESTSDSNDDNYQVVVQASDGGTTGDVDDAPPGYLNWLKVTVTVTDEQEDGEIDVTPTLTPLNWDIGLLQPEINVGITARVSDPDSGAEAIDTGVTWKWERRGSGSQWITILGVTEGLYVPQDRADDTATTDIESRIDLGDSLRVTATYPDATDATIMWTVQKVLANPVLGAVVTDNKAPAFESPTATRKVDENAAKGTLVGTPVTATDPDLEGLSGTPNRKVTYWLADNGNNNNALFTIDSATGQIKVKNDRSLDYEMPVGTTTGDPTKYVVIAMATDSSAQPSDAVTVTIDLIDLDDKPTIELVTASAGDLEDDPPTVISNAGRNAIEVVEKGQERVVTFTVSDQDGGVPSVRLSGADKDLFRIMNRDADIPTESGARTAGSLMFKAAPDFENPKDMHRDNVYEVTIVAADGRNTTELDVSVKVTNVEETGEARLEYQQPEIGRALTAEVEDPDGGFNPTNGTARTEVTGVRWEWHSTTANTYAPDDPTDACPAADANGGEWAAGAPSQILSRAASYTPEADDDKRCLRVTATYLDRTYVYPHPPGQDAGAGFDQTVQVVSGVVRVNPANKAPVFGEGIMRFVLENTLGRRYVDDPVTARDTPGDELVYALGGDDQMLFYVANSDTEDVVGTNDRDESADAGQIWVGARTRLDREGRDAYTVEVTATDTYGETDTADVAINVVDVDEAPVITAGGLSVRGNRSPTYAENRTDAVATYTADGADAAGARWTLSGDDMGDFRIGATTGVLTFRATPNYEAPVDADGNNVYQVTVNASSGDYSATLAVTVRVTNEDEGTNAAPAFGEGATASRSVPENTAAGQAIGAPVTATDPENDSITYRISGTDAASFRISSSTGQLMTYGALDYEGARRSFTVVVTATDAGGQSDTITVTINVTDQVLEGSASAYDTNNDGSIDRDEASQAVLAYKRGDIDKATVQEVIAQYQGI